jgi:HSP20 family protein
MTSELEKREKTEVRNTATEQMDDSGPAYSPDVDIYASDEELVFSIDVPGVGRGDATIHIDENNALVIRAKNTHKEPQSPVLRQFRVGNYYRAFQIGTEYDKEKVSAKLESGLLEVRIPRREEAKPRRIQISA